jgi:hypothetical protein
MITGTRQVLTWALIRQDEAGMRKAGEGARRRSAECGGGWKRLRSG